MCRRYGTTGSRRPGPNRWRAVSRSKIPSRNERSAGEADPALVREGVLLGESEMILLGYSHAPVSTSPNAGRACPRLDRGSRAHPCERVGGRRNHPSPGAPVARDARDAPLLGPAKGPLDLSLLVPRPPRGEVSSERTCLSA